MFKNRNLEIKKNQNDHLTYDVIFSTHKNKYTLAKIEKVSAQDRFSGGNVYYIKLIKDGGYGIENFEVFDIEDKRYIAFDRALKIVTNSIIDLMKEVQGIKLYKENQ